MKRILPIFLVVVLIVSVAGCGIQSPASGDQQTNPGDSEPAGEVPTTNEPDNEGSTVGTGTEASPRPSASAVPVETSESPTPSANASLNPDTSDAPTPEAPQQSAEPTVSPDVSEEPSPTPQGSNEDILSPEDAITVKVVGPDDLLLFEVALDPEGISTAFQALVVACEAEGVTLKYNGTGSTIYVQSIGNYAERSNGPLSGWVYKVNGESPAKSSSAVDVIKGDRVGFYYTLDLGKDVADKE